MTHLFSFPLAARLPARHASSLLCAALLGAGALPAHAVPTISVLSSADTVLRGQSFNVSVNASDMTDFFGYQFDLRYDPGLFRVTGVSAGPFLSGAGTAFFSPGTINNTTGTLSFVFETIVGNIGGVSGAGLLTTITMSALATASGLGTIGLANVSALDSALNPITLAPSTPASVSVVPEPAAAWLLVLGLAGVGWAARPRERAAGCAQG